MRSGRRRTCREFACRVAKVGSLSVNHARETVDDEINPALLAPPPAGRKTVELRCATRHLARHDKRTCRFVWRIGIDGDKTIPAVARGNPATRLHVLAQVHLSGRTTRSNTDGGPLSQERVSSRVAGRYSGEVPLLAAKASPPGCADIVAAH